MGSGMKGYFLFLQLYTGDNWCICWLKNVWTFSGHCLSEVFQIWQIITFAELYLLSEVFETWAVFQTI